MFAYKMGDGKAPLCLDCSLKLTQLTAAQMDMQTRHLNFLTGAMESQAGVPSGTLPRYPERSVVHLEGVTLNNIRIDRSTVGVVNTGTIGLVDSAVTALRQAG